MTPPRILFVSLEDPFRPTGGSAIRTRSLLLVLCGLGSVSLLVADGRGVRQAPKDDELARRLHAMRYLPFERRGIRKALSQGLKLAWPSQDIVLQGVGTALRDLAAGERFDVGIVSYTFLAHFHRALRPHVGTLVLDAHNIEWKTREQLARRAVTWPSRLRWIAHARALRQFEQRELPCYDRIWAVSPGEAEYFRRQYSGTTVRVVPSVVPDALPGPRVPLARRSPIVLFTGSLQTVENTRAATWLIRDIGPLVSAQVPGVKFVLAGRNPSAEVQGLAGGSCRLVANPERLDALYRDARVVVVPLREGSGTRLRIVEAFAEGVPVVTTTLGAEGLAVESGRHALVADSEQAFAEGVVRLLRDGALGEGLAARASALHRQEYSAASLARVLAHEFEGLPPQ